jgi:periplasmic protein CpxP/Spy
MIMKRMHQLVTGVVATLALGIAAAAYAHPGGGPGFGPGDGGFGPCAGEGPGMGPRSGAMGTRDGTRDPVAFAERRLAHLKAELKITSDQEGAWQAFAAKAKKQGEDMRAIQSKMPQGAATAPERMAQRSEMMKAGLAGMDTMAAALKDLYAVLSPEQKAIADRHFGGMGGHRRGHGMGRW